MVKSTRSVFWIRHLIATVLTVTVPCALFIIAGLVLLLFGGGGGSPLFLPGGFVLVVVWATSICVLVFFPCTVVAEWLTRRRRGGAMCELLISYGLLLCVSFPASLAFVEVGEHSILNRCLLGTSYFFGVHLIPLTFYWFITKSSSAIAWIRRRLGTDA
jgi:hypothetical protein